MPMETYKTFFLGETYTLWFRNRVLIKKRKQNTPLTSSPGHIIIIIIKIIHHISWVFHVYISLWREVIGLLSACHSSVSGVTPVCRTHTERKYKFTLIVTQIFAVRVWSYFVFPIINLSYNGPIYRVRSNSKVLVRKIVFAWIILA